MYFVSRSPRPSSVFTAQAKDSATDPMANTLMMGFENLRPNRPLIRKPMKGRIGMSQRFMSVFHGADVVDHQRLPVLEYGQNNGQPDGRFGGGHDHYEETEDMPVHLFQLVGESDEAEIHRVQHQLDGHEDGDDVAAVDESGDAEPEQDRAENQVPTQGNAGWHGQTSFLASTIAPRMAIRIRTEVTSKGSR